MRLLFVRHGESNFNTMNLIQGQMQSVLTNNGKKQAEALANTLKNEEFDAIYTSNLTRAIDTAQIINRFHAMNIIKTDSLNERALGVMEGIDSEECEKRYPGKILDPHYLPDGGETFDDVWDRVSAFLGKLKQNNVLIVTHMTINRAIIGILMDKTIEQAYELEQSSACINEIIINKTAELVKFNYTSHLKGIKIFRQKKGVI